MSYRRAHVDRSEQYWTYLPMDESDVPWKEEAEWSKAPTFATNLDMTPATNAQLLATGIDPR